MSRKEARRLLLRFVRWAFRALGGYHQTEHAEIVWASEVQAEVETAELRLYKHNMEIRYRGLCRMLNEELALKRLPDNAIYPAKPAN